jgi:endonuclease/exonuclease/phosphatase family metal-dependent hydrolase
VNEIHSLRIPSFIANQEPFNVSVTSRLKWSKGKVAGIGLLFVSIIVIASYGTIVYNQDQDAEAETAKIAAFNIQIFGQTKSQKQDVMAVLRDVVREFDIVLIQEIRDASEQTVPNFVETINQIEGPKYSFVRSERVGRTSSKEAYAYIYNDETVQFIQGSDYVYNDVDDVFEREPYVASFKVGNFDFVLVGIHTKPDDAYNEIGNLTFVVSSIQTANPTEQDIIVMGDFNADGAYFDEDDTSNLFKTSDYNWLITNDMDTMVKTNYTYDRIVVLDSTLSHEYKDGSAQVFYFDQVYGLNNQTFVSEISDHYPVFTQYKTNLVDDD